MASPHHAHVHDHEHQIGGIIRPEVLELTSVGLDIGSTTSHLTLSRLTLHRQGLRHSSRYDVVERVAIYRSPVRLTPYRDARHIDGRRLRAFFARAYRDAGIASGAVDTGVTIATGEAAKKENAPAVAQAAAAGAGRFVSVAAGPSMEAMLAAFGAGTVERSRRDQNTILNVDVGGGSCKAAVVSRGQIIETAAISIGARLVALDREGRVKRIEDPGRQVADSLGIPMRSGRRLTLSARRTLARRLADLTISFIQGHRLAAPGTRLLLTEPLGGGHRVDALCLSGGVAEYFYGYETRDHGDLGMLLARELRDRLPGLRIPIVEPDERIRATVIGLSQYTVQLSGGTIYTSEAGVLPLRDLPVVPVRLDGPPLSSETVCAAVVSAMKASELQDGLCALAFSCDLDPTHGQIRRLAEGISAALARAGWGQRPAVLIFDRDIAGLVGALLTREVRYPGPVVSIDEVEVRRFEYVDIGAAMPDGGAVPVVVKSLIFGGERRP
ncbi:MAG: ethanolamine ammonia-lyase reactivating factor EutA [bacterium]